MEGTTARRGRESFVDQLRRPEYTGENRCIPCTVTNLGIAGVLSAGAFLLSPALAAGVALLSATAIYLRGYLVPGTPELTKRYFPARLLALFDEGPAGFDAGSFAVESELLRAAAVVPAGDDLNLDPAFAAAWYAEMETLTDRASQRTALAALTELDVEALRLDARPGRFVAWYDGEWIGQWESRSAFVADVAAAPVVAARLDDWETMPVAYRSELLAGLRLFLDRCPTCGGDVAFGTDVVESCCRSYDVVAANCVDCDARLFEVPLDESMAAMPA
ncbi:hypothetical protein [Haloarchaeobius iranensis]|uniref:Uncharacterized protein n=1 Tax=Haloarchaeobius iranensis TaxID=996166 RepID=A0A1G9TSE7_9EURY|nr:hypothetical protein [Haloarchaeobius iranensis]SDM50582.1 hypothetical protein SAMN05192554_103102 [Haloarchaeobius iranensis]